jgi:hypothetical protein
MRIRFPLGIALVLAGTLAGSALGSEWDRLAAAANTDWSRLLMAAGSVPGKLGMDRGRLGTIAARQDLRDKVAVAVADGHLSRPERADILAKARSILEPEEYRAFKYALNRNWPPPKKHWSSHLAGTHPILR